MEIRRALIVHTGGGIGDVLLATPVAAALKERWPEARVDFLAREATAEVLRGNPHVDEVLTLPIPSPGVGALGWAGRLRARHYDAGLVLWSKTALAWMLYLAGIPVRVGQDSRVAYSFLYTHRVRVRSEHGDTESHWSDILLDYVRALGVEAEPCAPVYRVPEEARRRAEELLRELPGEGPLVGLHSGKGNVSDPGRWPVDVFAGWARALKEELGARLVLTGGWEEVEMVGEVERRAGVECLNLAGRTDLPLLAAVARRCAVFVCPDSGPMHLAAAVGTPTVGVYALEEDFPRRWAPVGAPRRLVRPAVRSCRPGCRKASCPDFRCYRQVTPEMVVAAARELLC